MKLWSIAALLTGMIVVPLVIRLRKHRDAKEQVATDQRYTIDDLIADRGSLA